MVHTLRWMKVGLMQIQKWNTTMCEHQESNGVTGNGTSQIWCLLIHVLYESKHVYAWLFLDVQAKVESNPA
eukprot:m.358930 g.358930  ORF g.358930 m.358930 type:complete len:71 (+) comp18344_c0_seq1:32-244(+)